MLLLVIRFVNTIMKNAKVQELIAYCKSYTLLIK